MERYLSLYGWHFSKAMCMWAVSMMRDRNGAKIQPMTKDQVKELFSKDTITMPESKGYDDVYLVSMVKADFWGSSIVNDSQLCKMVADILGDKDGYEGMVFTRFYADTVAKGVPIIWEDMI